MCVCDTESEKLTIEHLVMFNREKCGLHHPGNIVACCKDCNQRKRGDGTKMYFNWSEQLESVCDSAGASIEEFRRRRDRISEHIHNENYPKLTEDEKNALRVLAQDLYENINLALDRTLQLFERIDKTLVRRR